MSELPAVAGSGPADQRRAAIAEIEAIVDPCSRTIGKPIGLASMGLIDRLEISDGSVSVRVLPTFPDCLFRGVFEEEIEKRLLAMPWCDRVAISFCPPDKSWDESRLSAGARVLLGRRPAGRRDAPESREER